MMTDVIQINPAYIIPSDRLFNLVLTPSQMISAVIDGGMNVP